jgi:uncharacterized protein YkwD
MTVTRRGRAAALGLVAGLFLLLCFAWLIPASSSPAAAADAETAALIGYMNSYRASQGVGPLGLSGAASAATQANAEKNADRCAIGYLTPGYTTWNNYGYETANQLWNAWLADPFLLPIIADPDYKSAGVGRARSPDCNLGWIWSTALSFQSGGTVPPPPTSTSPPTVPPTPPKTPSPSPTVPRTPSPSATQPPATPTASPTPTPTSSLIVTASPTQSPVSTPTPTPTQTDPDTPTPVPSPTSFQVHGDVNCDGRVNAGDGVLVLRRAAHMAALAPCLEPNGVDCQGAIDTVDALAIFQFIGGLHPNLPAGCPLLGEHILPTATPTPAATPTPTPTTTPTTASPSVTAAPTPTSPPAGPGIHHCFLAILSYEVVNAPALAGEATCSVGVGTPYACDFPPQYNDAECAPTSSGGPALDCYVYQQDWAWCDASSGPDYQCSNNDNGTTLCFPIGAAGPEYICAVGDAITCLTEDAAPHFACTREGQAFACSALE